ncbi:hypothetical protein [Agrobacterium tumefaciens]|uniref:hypothetical protein n=1 Tax=Agrobacterium tumefaciens TaxID=358 RepID=UPI0015725E98|nr:hypothetical protein [Agrobacterium tumefaciens]
MPNTENLLSLVREIADPSEAVIQEARQIAADENTPPEIAAACRDLEARMRQVFEIASYLVKETRR